MMVVVFPGVVRQSTYAIPKKRNRESDESNSDHDALGQDAAQLAQLERDHLAVNERALQIP